MAHAIQRDNIGVPQTANALNDVLPLPGNPAAGSLVVAGFGRTNGTSAITPHADFSTVVEDEGGSPCGGLYMHEATGLVSSWTFASAASGQLRGQLLELPIIDLADPVIDSDIARLASSNTGDSPTVTVAEPAIIVAHLLTGGAVTEIDTDPADLFSRLPEVTNRSRFAVRTVVEPGTYGVTFNWVGAQVPLIAIAAFRIDPALLSQFLRPDSLISNGGGFTTNNNVAGDPLHQVVNDEVSDDGDEENLPHADRTVQSPSAAEITLGMSIEKLGIDAEDPGVNTGHVARWTWRSLINSTVWDYDINVYSGATLIATRSFDNVSMSFPPLDAEEFTLTSDEVDDLRALAVGGFYQDVRGQLISTQVSGTADRQTIHFFEIEVPFAAGGGGGPEAKEGTDTPTVSVSETSSIASDATGSDTPALSLTEDSALSVDATGSDSPSVGVTESAALLAASEMADTVALGLTESASVEVLGATEPKAGSDDVSIGLVETAAVLEDRQIAASDTVSVGLTESASVVEPPPPDPDPIGLVHRFILEDGSVERVLPVLDTHPMSLVGNFQGGEVAPGGYDAASGEISQDEYAGNPDLYIFGTKWKVERDGSVIWSGTLDDPDDSGPTVILKGLGSATEAERNFERAMWLTRLLDEWTISDAEPFDYDTDTNKIKAEARGQELRFWVTRGTTFRNQPNNDKSGTDGDGDFWATGLLRWFPTVDVRGISFDIKVSQRSDDYKVQVLSAPTLNDPLTVRGTFGLDSADLVNKQRSIDCAIPTGNEIVMVRIRRRKLEKKAARWTARCRNVAVRGLASDDNYKTHEVVNDLADKVQPTWDRTGVQVSTQRVGPLDTEGESAATILDDLGALDDWRWLALDEEWEWGPWDTRTWIMTEGRFPRALVPLDRFNGVEIPFRYGGGYVSRKTVMAATYVPGTLERIHRIELDRPPPEDIATVFAQHIADYLWTVRKAGTAEFTWVEAEGFPGIEVDGWQVHAGDTLIVGDMALRITSKSFTDTTVQVSFDDSHPLLRKLEARRTRALALGQGQARATLGELGLERPKTPTNVLITFDFEKTRKQGRRYDAIVDWAEVTEDIEDQATAIGSYVVEYRYVKPDDTKTRRRQVRIKAQGDDDDPNDPIPTRARIRDLDHPHAWEIELRVWSVDVLGKESAPSAWSAPVKPANWTPPPPTGATYVLNRKKLELEFDVDDADEQEDDDGTPTIDRDVAYVKCKRFVNTGSGWTQTGKTLRLMGTGKTWAVRKPRGKSFKVQLWSVGDHGNTSTMVEVNATRKKPGKPTVRSRRRSPRRIEWVMNPPTTWHDGAVDDFDQDSVEAYDYTVLHNGVVDEDRSDHHRKGLNFSIEIPKDSTGWKLQATSKGVDGEDSDLETEPTTIDDEELLPPSFGDGLAPATPTAPPTIKRGAPARNAIDMSAYARPEDFSSFLTEFATSADGFIAWTELGPSGSVQIHDQLDYALQYIYRFRVLDIEGLMSGYSPATASVVPRRVSEQGVVDIAVDSITTAELSILDYLDIEVPMVHPGNPPAEVARVHGMLFESEHEGVPVHHPHVVYSDAAGVMHPMTRPSARMSRKANQTISNNTLTLVTFPGTALDWDDMGFRPATTNYFTFPHDGKYRVTAGVTWDSAGVAGGNRQLQLQLTDAADADVIAVLGRRKLENVGPGEPGQEITEFVEAQAGWRVRLRVIQTSGSGLAILGTSFGAETWMVVEFLRPPDEA